MAAATVAVPPRSTLTGFRSWVITYCPVAPGLRPGHLAELEAARQNADQRIAQAARQHDEAVEEAAAAAGQARDEVTRTHAAETGMRSELDRTRADASQLITHALADAARERGDLRAWAGQQVEQLQAELQHVREEATCLVGQVRDSAAIRIAVLEEATARLQTERDHLAASLQAAQQLSQASTRTQRQSRSPGPPGRRATKRAQMIELAGQRRDLSSVPLAEVAQLAS